MSETPTIIKEKKYLPPEAITMFGCSTCEWKGDTRCPHPLTNLPTQAICTKKKQWLQAHTPNYNKQPSFTRWQRDFNLAIANPMIQKYYQLQLSTQNKILTLEQQQTKNPLTDQELKSLKQLRHNITTYYQNWVMLWKHQTHYADQQVHRDTPKEVLVKKIDVSPRKVAEMIRKANKEIDITDKVEVKEDGV